MGESTSGPDLFNQLADEFAERYRQGERPSLSEYTDKYPDLSDQIRELFPALVVIEQFGTGGDQATGSVTPGPNGAARVPEQLGDYRILREIARGGMGIVYEAIQESLGRHVALKVLPHFRLADPNQLVRFQREARAAAMLHHTNIVPVFGVGEHEGVHYYAMQYIQGQSLDAVLHEVKRLRGGSPAAPAPGSGHDPALASSVAAELVSGRFAPQSEAPAETESQAPSQPADPAQKSPTTDLGTSPGSSPSASSILGRSGSSYSRSVARIGVQAAEALAYAHHQKLLHRDIKPSNLLLDLQGTVWVTDFGLAKAEGTDALTHTGDLVGTLRYMAPERFVGQADARSDVYALGLTLYEMLTLEPAFQAEQRARLIDTILHADPPRPRQLDPLIARDLETVVLKAMAKEPADRYRTASELAEDLRRYLADRPILARRVSLAGRLLRWGRRNKAVAGLLASVVVTLAIGFAVSTAQWIRADRHADREATLRADIARKLYTSDMLAIQQAWEAGNVERIEELLRRHFPDPGQPDLRGFEWDVYQRHLQRSRPSLSSSCSDTPYIVTATPDGRTLASLVYVHAPHSADERVEFVLCDASTDWKPRILADSPGTFSDAIALSPDGRVFATGSQFNGKDGNPQPITLWDTATGRPIRKGPRGRGAIVTMRSLAFLPDGKKLIWAGNDTKINLWDLETETVRSFEGNKGYHIGVALDPAGRRIASATSDGIVRLWDSQSGSEVHTFTNVGVAPDVAFSPDGRYLAVSSRSGLRTWDLTRPQDPREVELKGQRNEGATSPAFSPDGRYLAAGIGSAVKVWEVDGGELRATIRGHSLRVWWTRFLDGGRILASGSEDRTVKLWDVAQALAERDMLKAHSGNVESLAFGPDGLTLFSGGSDGEIGRWDVATGRKLGRIGVPGLKKPAQSLAVSLDGLILADSRVGLWDLKIGELITLASGGATAESAVAFSPVESVLAMTDASGDVTHPNIRLWDVVTKKPLHLLNTPPRQGVLSMSFSPDGRILASAGWDSKVTLWEVTTGRELTNHLVGHAGAIPSVAFSPDGRALASGSRDGTVMIWDVTDAAKPSLQHKLNANAGSVWAVAYSPDGKSIASGHDDGTVKLWDPVTERERCTLVGHTGPVRTLAFSPKGSVLATGDASGEIRLWRR